MRERISVSQAAGNFFDLLNRMRDEGESFVIVHNGEEVGILSPARETRPKTFNELVEMIQAMGPPDEDFARDLEEIRLSQGALPEDPWRFPHPDPSTALGMTSKRGAAVRGIRN